VLGRLPPVANRYRCSACGNLTRFDVITSWRTRAFHHYTVGGELHVEEETVLDENVDEVSCRWCGTGASVERLDERLEGQGGTSVPAHDSPRAT
jgi:hypothetical protein